MIDLLKSMLYPPIREHRIFFLHVPKCGGSSMRKALANCYKPWRKGNQTTVFQLRESAAAKARKISEIDQAELTPELRKYMLHYLMYDRSTKCILGHFPHSLQAIELFSDPWEFITVLRSPVDRWLSAYRYNIQQGVLDLSMEQFIETEQAKKVGTLYTRMFSGCMHASPGELGETHVRKAITELNKFDLVGALEKLERFKSQFEERYKRKLLIPRINTTATNGFAKNGNIPAEIEQRVQDLCKLDSQVYSKALNARS